jgi:hypothetical protein
MFGSNSVCKELITCTVYQWMSNIGRDDPNIFEAIGPKLEPVRNNGILPGFPPEQVITTIRSALELT